MAVTHRVLFYIFLANLFDSKKCVEAGLQKVLADLNRDDFTSAAIAAEKARVSGLFYRMKSKWAEIKRNKEKFEEKHKVWLDTEFILPPAFHLPSSKAGRPKLDFSEKGERAKRQETQQLREENSTEKLLHSTLSSLKASKEQWHHDVHFILKQCLDDHSMAGKYRKMSGIVTPLEKVPSRTLSLPQPLSSTDSMVYFYETSHTVDTYTTTRLTMKQQNADVLVPYSKILSEKKHNRPDNISYSEYEASVPLADLFHHTNKRIFEASECYKVFQDVPNDKPVVIETDYKCGWDSATGQSIYKQKFETEEGEQKFVAESLLSTCIVPLRFRYNGLTIWENPVPQGANFCRPVKLAFEKETNEAAASIKANLQSQIDQLGNQLIPINNHLIECKLNFHLTMLDGKAKNGATDHASTQSCFICQAKPNDFNNLTNFTSGKFSEDLDCLKHGISPLHQWIRCLDAILHLGYKLGTGRWRMNKALGDESVIQTKKRQIQKELKEKLGLVVDMPKPGGAGNTNDGNTARRLFQNYAVFAQATGVSEDLIYHFYILLCLINCRHQIDVPKFAAYCTETAMLWVEKYPWYKMPVSIHVLLVHGVSYLKMIDMPISDLTEQCIETGNKISKHARLHHTRKTSRLDTMTDHFNRLMEISDPVVATKLHCKRQARVRQEKKEDLPEMALSILVSPSSNNLDDSGIGD